MGGGDWGGGGRRGRGGSKRSMPGRAKIQRKGSRQGRQPLDDVRASHLEHPVDESPVPLLVAGCRILSKEVAKDAQAHSAAARISVHEPRCPVVVWLSAVTVSSILKMSSTYSSTISAGANSGGSRSKSSISFT